MTTEDKTYLNKAKEPVEDFTEEGGGAAEEPVAQDATSIGSSEISRETSEDSQILRIKPSEKIDEVVVENSKKFSDLEDHKVDFVDFYQDTRTFLAKTNSTKFILITYLMLSIPVLLVYGYIAEDIYKDMVILLAITYLGVDVYEKKSLVRKK